MVHDKIIAYPKGQQFRWTMLNLGKVHITGLDFEAYGQMQISKVKAGLRLQYTYQRAIDVTDENDSYYKHQIPYIPEHSGSAIADIEWKAFTFVYSPRAGTPAAGRYFFRIVTETCGSKTAR